MEEEVFFSMVLGKAALDSGVQEFKKGNIEQAISIYTEALNMLPDVGLTVDLRVNLLIRKGLALFALEEWKGAALAFGEIPDSIELAEEIVWESGIRMFLRKGHSYFFTGDYENALIFYNAVKKISMQDYLRLVGHFGATLAKFKTEGKSLSFLTSKLGCHTYPWIRYPCYVIHDIRLFAEHWYNKSFSRENLDKSIEDLNVANAIVEAFPPIRTEDLAIEINKKLCVMLYKKNKKQEARKAFSKCIDLKPGLFDYEPGFFQSFLKSEQTEAAREEKSGNLQAAADRLWLLSFLTSSSFADKYLKDSVKMVIQLHYRLFEIESRLHSQSEGYLEKVFEVLENLYGFLEEYGVKDEKVAAQMKDKGNFFLKKQKYNLAKQLYTYALGILPHGSVNTKRILLSNRSHVQLLLENYDCAISDAKSCISLSSDWPKGHLRLGRGYSHNGQYRNAHKSFIECYRLASGDERPEVLKNVFMNISCTPNEKDQKAMSLPSGITAELVNKCIGLLCSDPAPLTSTAVVYIFTKSKFASAATAKDVLLTEVIKNRFSDECTKLLLDRGADPNMAVGDLSPLQAALNNTESSTSVVHLVKKGADVKAFLPEIKDEPSAHVLLRLCLKLGKEDLFERALQEIDVNVVDSGGNTLLHIIAKEDLNNTVKNCFLALVKGSVIDPQVVNKDKKKAIDLLLNQEDERRTLIADYEKKYVQNSNEKNISKKKKNKKKKRQRNETGCDEALHNEEVKQEIAVDENEQQADWEAEVEKESVNKEDTAKSSKNERNNISHNEEVRKNISDCIKNFVQVDISEIVIEEKKDNVDDPASCATEDGSAPVDGSEDIEEEDGESVVREVIEMDEDDLVDVDGLEGLPWDVQCTSEFWKKLKDNKLEEFIKKKILKKIELLASGDWRTELAVRLKGPWRSTGIRLYEAKLDKGARILWEEAVAFSERCSMSSEETADAGQNEDKFIYTDAIRLWDFTLNHDEVPRLIDRIVRSRLRGQSCTIKKKLKSLPVESSSNKEKGMRFPKRYVVDNERYHPQVSQQSNANTSAVLPSWNDIFFPSGSPNEKEYHILKFYALSSAMANSVLLNTDQNLDFPFQVSELEHFIIRLKPTPLASVLLLGRSGTGKTTCCLYRLWNKFKTYWERASTAGPHIPVLQRLLETFILQDEDKDANTVSIASDNTEISSENFESATSNGTTGGGDRVMSCGCRGTYCFCALAAFKTASSFDSDGSKQGSDTNDDKEEQETESDVDDKISSDSLEEDENDEEPLYRHLRQLFITKNKVLCHEVKRNFQDLCRAVPEAQQHAERSAEVSPSDLNKMDEFSYPLFLGSRDLLMMLDATLPGKSFFVRDISGKLLNPVPGWGENEGHLSFLPTLDSDDEYDSENDDEDTTNENTQSRITRQTSVGIKEVTYTVFCHEIWPKIERKFKSSYHPSLVWTEIRSFIKGTVQALSSENGYMSKDDYESVGRKKAPSFSGNRNIIYQMFRLYDKMCKARNLFDEFDLLYNVYQRLSKHPLQEWLFDEIYVDETQDFTEAELFTLIRCCQNPNQLFFTGDTAQSIMRGVAFRFSDLRSLFYNARSVFAGKKGSCVVVPDQVHQLTYNYRSHKGILNLATSVVSLLGHFFPESFDKLENDVGLFDGPKPVILETSDFSDLALMLSGARRETSPIEFGAHQVVIVASEESKSSLPEELSCALVLSIYEAKGLEFDDVLLYNFFKDSQARDEWRVVNTYTTANKSCSSKEKSLGNGIIRKTAQDLEQNLRPLVFDYSKHKILNSELKQLYTALTRARVNVWIYDEDRENRAPMFDYFKREGLVEILRLDQNDETPDKGMFAEESSLADWQKQGMFFYKKELWRPAYKCFQRTQNTVMLDRCSAHLQALKAYHLGMEWREHRASSLKSVQDEYVIATLMYLKCGMGEESLICLKNAKEWKLLADLFKQLGKYHEAGRYYSKAGLPLEAAECYEKNGDLRNAVDLLYNKEYFTECIEVLRRYERSNKQSRSKVLRPPRSTISLETVVIEAADSCRKRKQFESMEAFLRNLPLEDQLQYLRKPECETVLLDVLMINGRIEDAVRIHMDKGRYLEAAALTSDKETKGECHLEHARILYRKWAAKKKKTMDQQKKTMDQSLVFAGDETCPDSLIHAIEECITLLSDGSIHLAHAYEMRALVKPDASSCTKAIDLYTHCQDYFAALLCNTFLLEIGEGDTEAFAANINKVYLVVTHLLQAQKHSYNESLRVCHSFFGIEEQNDSGYAVNMNKLQFRLCVLNKQLHFSNEIKNSFTSSDPTIGNRQLAMLMLGFVNRLSTKLRDVYDRELHSEEICEDYLQGVVHEACDRNHFIPDLQTAQRRLNAFFAIIQLDGVTRKFIANIKNKDESVKEVLQGCRYLSKYFSDEYMLNVCREFYEEFIDYTYHLSPISFSGVSLANCLPIMPFVKEQILWYVKSIWESADEPDRFGDMNLFLEVSFLSNFVSVSYSQTTVDEIRKIVQTRYPTAEPIPRNEGVIYNNRENFFESFHTIFADSKAWLHEEGALVESIHCLLRRTLVIPLRRSKQLPMPDLINIVSLLEFSVALCIVTLCRINRKSNAVIVMPGYYFEGIEFWSALYTKCQNGYTALESTEYVNKPYLIINLLREVVSLILREKYEHFDLFGLAFGKDAIRSQGAERFFVLLLVLLSNAPLIELPLESIRGFLREMTYFATVYAEGNDRLSRALQRVSQTKGEEHARQLLRVFLNEKGNMYVECNWMQIYQKYLKHVYMNRQKDSTDKVNSVKILGHAREEKEMKNDQALPGFVQKDAVPMEEKMALGSKDDGADSSTEFMDGQDGGSTADKKLGWQISEESVRKDGQLAKGQRRTRREDEDYGEDIDDEIQEGIRDSSTLSTIERQERHRKAACMIQRWWRNVSSKRRSNADGPSKAERILIDHQKYVIGLTCKPCGKTFDSKPALESHILEDAAHIDKSKAFDAYHNYESSVVIPYLKIAEDMLDKEIPSGQKVSELECARKLEQCLGDVVIARSLIERLRKWTETTDMKAYIETLKKTCQELEDELHYIERGEHYPEDEHQNESNFANDDDFQLVTKKKRRKDKNTYKHGSKNTGKTKGSWKKRA